MWKFFLILIIQLVLQTDHVLAAQAHMGGLAWLHIPKAGSTFCMTIQHVANKTLFESLVARKDAGDKRVQLTTYRGCISLGRFAVPHMWHEPWKPGRSKWVGFFREPKSRLISAFFDFAHHEGIDSRVFVPAMRAVAKKNVTTRFAAYLTNFDMRGCQVIILLLHAFMLLLIFSLCVFFMILCR